MTQAFNLSQLANNLDSSGRLDATDGLVNAVPIANGGTGASNASGAALNLYIEVGKLLYPVGSIYINAGVTTNPSTLLGFGTWTAFGAGRVAVGLNTSDALFDTLEETGGSKDSSVISHSHTGSTSTVDAHQHLSPDGQQFITSTPGGIYGGGGSSLYQSGSNSTQGAGAHNHTITIDSAGVSGTNANLQPYITVAMWKRTA